MRNADKQDVEVGTERSWTILAFRAIGCVKQDQSNPKLASNLARYATVLAVTRTNY